MDGMNSRPDRTTSRAGLLNFIDWLNEKVYKAAGPPPLGPYEPIVESVGAALCPVCGQPMSQHFIDHSTRNTILNCPVDHIPLAVDNRPVNELGIAKTGT